MSWKPSALSLIASAYPWNRNPPNKENISHETHTRRHRMDAHPFLLAGRCHCRNLSTVDRFACPQREPERVGRPDPIGTSQRTVRLTEWTRCGTEGFLGPHRGQGPRRFGRKPEARSQARWVTEQNSDTKQPRRRQSTRIAVGGSTEEEATKAGKASAGNFCLDRNL